MSSGEDGDELDTIKVSPHFLLRLATEHTWIFSAIAELIDNAYDANAKELQIDVIDIGNIKCLAFLDNGNGMNGEALKKMLSLGFCEKFYQTKYPVGYFGTGFKSGSLRLGKDVLVFTHRFESACIGFLSLTFHEEEEKREAKMFVLEYTWPDLEPVSSVIKEKFETSLKVILEFSPFESEEDLKRELQGIKGNGTKIIISNLRKSEHLDEFELNFTSDINDILCFHDETTPKFRYSLREYCSILYYQPRLRVILRGEKVATKLIPKSLSNTWEVSYKPSSYQYNTKVIFGLSDEPDTENYGMMLYYQNRLIKPYEKVPCQKRVFDPVGRGVVGVTRANFLKPTHYKQDFSREDKMFDAAMKAYSEKVKWYVEKILPSASESQPLSLCPDSNWKDCYKCNKWRRLPDRLSKDDLPETWCCQDNPDEAHNNCEAQEELDVEDEMDIPRKSRLGITSEKQGTARCRGNQNQPSTSRERENQPSTSRESQNQPATSRQSQTGTSRQSQPGTSRERENPPSTSRESTSQPGTSRQSQPGTSRQSQPGTSRQSQPGTSRQSQPGTSRQSQPGTSRQSQPGTSRQIQPGISRQIQPGTSKQIQPDASRESQNQPISTAQDDEDVSPFEAPAKRKRVINSGSGDTCISNKSMQNSTNKAKKGKRSNVQKRGKKNGVGGNDNIRKRTLSTSHQVSTGSQNKQYSGVRTQDTNQDSDEYQSSDSCETVDSDNINPGRNRHSSSQDRETGHRNDEVKRLHILLENMTKENEELIRKLDEKDQELNDLKQQFNNMTQQRDDFRMNVHRLLLAQECDPEALGHVDDIENTVRALLDNLMND